MDKLLQSQKRFNNIGERLIIHDNDIVDSDYLDVNIGDNKTDKET